MGRGGGGEGRSVQSMGEMGKDFCPNFLQSFLEKINRRSCNDGAGNQLGKLGPESE